MIRQNGPWRNIEEVEFATLEWVDWFNNRRLFEPIGNIPPAEFEAMYYPTNEAPAPLVGLTWCVLGFSEANFWTHAAIDDAFCISYSTGVNMPSAECLRWGSLP